MCARTHTLGDAGTRVQYTPTRVHEHMRAHAEMQAHVHSTRTRARVYTHRCRHTCTAHTHAHTHPKLTESHLFSFPSVTCIPIKAAHLR